MASRSARTRYVALLRGINVGGRNPIRMPALRSCFEEQGFADVSTYIASGNVLFSAGGASATLTRRIEAALAATFGYPASIVLRSRAQMGEVVAGAPRGFGAKPTEFRYDVWFLKEPLLAADALAAVPTREGVDRVWAGERVLYVSRVTERAAESRVTRVIGKPVYQSLTIRNWNTTTKLLALLEGA